MTDSRPATQPLQPRSGNASWTPEDAAHLLRRAQFGVSAAEIEQAATAGLDATVARLVQSQPETDEFLATEKVLRNVAMSLESIGDLKAWWLYRMHRSANPLVEKMCLFWHSHFATSYAKVGSVPHMAAQNDLLRRCALRSFRELLHGMSGDVAMLIWLDGNANKKRHANENFAREVMELFSLGVGNYTEEDIAEAARAFTGWHVREDKFWFNRIHHDFGSKRIFGNTGNYDGDEVIDLCLEQSACPRFLATKLLKAFVTPQPDAAAVEQFAVRIRQHDFDMRPAMEELFRSEYFYRDGHRHALIKSPLELVLGAHRELSTRPNLANSARLAAELGQDVFFPPTVKGWDGGRLWINSATLLQRANFAAELTHGKELGTLPDLRGLVSRPGSYQRSDAIAYYARLMLGERAEPAVVDRLETYLKQARGHQSERLLGLVHLIMTLPEYQLV